MTLPPRQQDILELARERVYVSIDELAQAFGVTPQTIRRDINQLAKHANTYRDKISPEIFLYHTIQMAKHLEHRDFMNKFLKQIYQAIK